MSVVELDKKHNLTPEELFSRLARGEYENVVVAAMTKEGDLCWASSDGTTNERAVWLLQQTQFVYLGFGAGSDE